MSSTLIFVGLPEDSRSSITKTLSVSECRSVEEFNHFLSNSSITNTDLSKRGVPNAPKSCIAEIFSSDATDGAGGPVKNGASRPRVVRDTPTRPRDTHSRLFGQVRTASSNGPVAPMVTDTIRSHIQFGDKDMNGGSPSHSPSKMNGSAASTPSRASYSPPKRNPVTGDGVVLPPTRRRHPAASQRGADPDHSGPDILYLDHDQDHHYPDQDHHYPDQDHHYPDQDHHYPDQDHHYPDQDHYYPDLGQYYPDLNPQPTHRYFTRDWPPLPAQYYVESTAKPTPNIHHTPYTLLGLKTDDPEKPHPIIDPDSLSPQLVLDRPWPPFPAQHYLEPKEHKIPYHPLPPYAFVGMTSALGDRPKPDYKYNPIPTLDAPIDPFLIANLNPPPSLFKYERDGPIPDVTPLPTEVIPGPHTLTGFPPIFHKHVPGYLFNLSRHAEDFTPRTYYVDYVRRREMEGNPITGDGYKSMNGQINTVTSVNGTSHIIHNSRVPPGGFSSGLW